MLERKVESSYHKTIMSREEVKMQIEDIAQDLNDSGRREVSPVKIGPARSPIAGIGAASIAALAVGAAAIGALAIGIFAIGQLVVRRLSVKEMRIGHLNVDSLSVKDIACGKKRRLIRRSRGIGREQMP